MQPVVVALLGALLILAILRDAFEILILPQSVSSSLLRPARIFYRLSWSAWAGIAGRLRAGRPREGFLAVYGPLSMLVLFAVWASFLILGFAMLQYGFGSNVVLPDGRSGFLIDLYMSGTTFYTLGLGDVTPRDTISRVITVSEAGIGFGFLAAIISYLPVLYQAFSRREIGISLLDARAGSPPTAEVLVQRECGDVASLERLLAEWERWAAEVMESHLSYPTLAYYRSQHQNQSWVAALTTILDTSAFVQVSFDGAVARQARLTFAMARHAVVDLSRIFRAPPAPPPADRLPPETLARMRDHLAVACAATPLRLEATTDTALAELRRLYDPYVHALGLKFHLVVPAWGPERERPDNWRTSAWERAAARRRAELHDEDGA